MPMFPSRVPWFIKAAAQRAVHIPSPTPVFRPDASLLEDETSLSLPSVKKRKNTALLVNDIPLYTPITPLDVNIPSPVLPFGPKPVFIQVSSLLPEDLNAPARVAALCPSVFAHPIRRDILHLCVTHYLDGIRQGTAANKSRAEVRGSGRKVRQQKGTGKARLGDAQSPMLVGGGRAFAKKARDFSTKLPRKVIQMGMRVALSAKVREDALGVVETLEIPFGKTRVLEKLIEDLGWQKTLFITGADEVPTNLERSSRVLDYVHATTASSLNIHEAIKWQRMVLDFSAVEFFERTLGKPHVDGLAGM